MDDFITRIGNLQTDNRMEEERVSIDKVVNACGRELLQELDNNGMMIFNGVGKFGDEDNFSFILQLEASVIDFGSCRWKYKKWVRKVEVNKEGDLW